MSEVEALVFKTRVDTSTGKAELAGLVNELEKTGKQGKAALSAVDQAADRLIATFGGFFTIRTALNFVTSSFDQFAKTERQWAAITAQLRAFGDTNGYVAKRVRESIDALARQSGLLDDDLIPAYQRLFVGTQDAAASQDLLTIAARFAANGIGDVQTNADKLASFLQTGMVRGLTEFGVHTKDAKNEVISADEAVRQLIANFHLLPTTLNDAQAKLDTLSQKFNRLGASISGVINSGIDANMWNIGISGTLLRGLFGPESTPDRLKPARGGGSGHRDGTMLENILGVTPPQVAEAKEKATRALSDIYKLVSAQNQRIFESNQAPSPLVSKLAAGAHLQGLGGADTTGNALGFEFNGTEQIAREAEAVHNLNELLSQQVITKQQLRDADLQLQAAGVRVTESQQAQIDAAGAQIEAHDRTSGAMNALASASQFLALAQSAAAQSGSANAKKASDLTIALIIAEALIQAAFEDAAASQSFAEDDYYHGVLHAIASKLYLAVGYKNYKSATAGPPSAGGGGGGGGGGHHRGGGRGGGDRTFNVSSGSGSRNSGSGKRSVKIYAWDGESVEQSFRKRNVQRVLQEENDRKARRR